MNIEQITALKALIATEPLNAGRTDEEVLAWCNEPVTVSKDITFNDLTIWGANLTNARFKIWQEMRAMEADTSTLNNGQKGSVLALSDLFNAGGGSGVGSDFAFAKNEMRQIVNAIDGGVVISNPDRAALLQLAEKQVTRPEADPAIGTSAHLGDVQHARIL